ncbi:short-chain dehydrogenase/reductase SDR [Tolypothrix sp. NIES-4075]|uniref:type I polyketide synthase n=1 Tax=Tolypothrix sp. NIES-4075 TaxID=2005459 RepID=UPI000B5C4FE9|nr:type I polyketide synthase [Tolypothrix sp. NIES-4075]GAX39732.1 short-chain dehydrogenase/reductase SDR [Tolypothrix sp. NIES-4075]
MQFGLMFFASSEEALIGDKYHLVIDSAKFADQHGFSSLWVPERHFTKFGCLYPNPAVLHAALARETKHLRLQAGSVVVPIHNPIRIAEEWAVVDNLSGGRVGISFAPGWNPDDFAFFPERYQDRHKEMFSGIEIVQKLWQGKSISATNGIGNQIDLRIYPTPIQKELPIWLTAAGSPQTFIKAGEIGANLLTHLLDQTIEQLAEKIALYRQARAKHGHDPKTGVVTVMLHTFVGEDMNVVRELVRAPYCEYLKSNIGLLKNLGSSRGHSINIAAMSPKDLDDFVNFLFERFASSRGLIGTPETCVNLLEQLDSIGVDEAACLLDFGPSADLILKHLPYLNQLKERYNVDQKRSPLNNRSTVAETLTALSFSGTSNNGANSSLELPEQIQARCQEEILGSEFYHKLRQYSVQLEASFQGIEHIWRRDGEALGLVQLLEELKPSADAYKIHPAFLDACFQVLVAALPTYSLSNNGGTLYIPAGLGSLEVYGSIDKQVWSHAVLRESASDSADELKGDVYIRDRQGKMLVKASGLRLRRTETARQTSQENLNDWFYELQWEATSLLEINNPQPEQQGSWLIFADSSGVGQKLAALLAARGETCFIISPSEVYQVSEQGQFWIDPSCPEQMHQLIENVLGPNQPQCKGAIHLWSLNETFSHQMTSASLETSQVLGVSSVLSLVQALSNVKQSVLPRLWLVTTGAQSIGISSLPAVAQTPLWGLGKTCATEHSDIWGGMVDLDPQATKDEAASQLLNVICGQDVEDQIVFRQGQPYVARLVQRESVENALTFSWRKDCSYLLTGGLGGIGLQVAQWMVEQGARHLILLGRTPLPPRSTWSEVEEVSSKNQIAAILNLEAQGASVYLASVDVADETQMTEMLQTLKERGCPPVRGVVHMAGIPGGKLLLELDATRMNQVLRPKVMGGWLLHRLFEKVDLDFFILFSSATHQLGLLSRGVGDYSAANAFLDGLADYRTAQGLPAVSIEWGPWAEVGMAARVRNDERLARFGIGSITPEQGLQAMSRALCQNSASVWAIPINWSQLLQMDRFAAKSPFLSKLSRQVLSQEGAALQSQHLNAIESEILQKLKQHSGSESPAETLRDRFSVLTAYIQGEVAKVLKLEPSKLPDSQQGFFDMGMDSLMAVELKNRLEASFGVSLPVTLTFEFPTIKDVAGYLAKKVMGWELPAASDTELPKGEDEQALALSQVEEISDDGIEASIAEELAKLENLVRGN